MPDLDVVKIIDAVRAAANEFCEKAKLKPGQTVVVGCSTSEICGKTIGTDSSADIGTLVFMELYNIFSGVNVNIAAQCCEHLNRAIILERTAATGYNIVNVVPALKAGGAFATAAYEVLNDPVAVESIQADAGLDIGGTLIGMHLKRVAVPLRLNVAQIGNANLTAARTRPPFIGGNRAMYDENLA